MGVLPPYAASFSAHRLCISLGRFYGLTLPTSQINLWDISLPSRQILFSD